VRSIFAFALACVPALYFSAELYDVLAFPLMQSLPQGSKMIATGVITPFLIPMKIAFMAAFLLALPYLLYEAWAFVAPGLYAHEKRLVLPLVVSSTLLFLLGMVFCYFIVFGKVFAFIASFAPKSITVAPDIEAYFNFVLGMFFAFGLAFEVPVVVVVLVLTGLVSVEQLREWRGYVVVAIFVVAAIVTPPDVVSQIALALPMCLLYEIGIVLGQVIQRRRKAQAELGERGGQP
jgi:sec-independent protein translocase protein TatC